jgi:hypothetical protein
MVRFRAIWVLSETFDPNFWANPCTQGATDFTSYARCLALRPGYRPGKIAAAPGFPEFFKVLKIARSAPSPFLALRSQKSAGTCAVWSSTSLPNLMQIGAEMNFWRMFFGKKWAWPRAREDMKRIFSQPSTGSGNS